MSQSTPTSPPLLYSYWRSTAAYRVRIALNLKDIAHEIRSVHLIRDGGAQHGDDYRALNPQGLVPTLCIDDQVLSQSMAIIEYLEEMYPWPALLPVRPAERARVRSLCATITCDVHPLNNLRVLQYLRGPAGISEDAKSAWYAHWVELGFTALETRLARSPLTGQFCHGDTPGMADIVLVGQMYNARRFECDVSGYPVLRGICDRALALDAFDRARPENQADAAD
ncbi:MAG: maleylacetoacetate isomerase [Gammaproteobacteria bacterium]